MCEFTVIRKVLDIIADVRRQPGQRWQLRREGREREQRSSRQLEFQLGRLSPS